MVGKKSNIEISVNKEVLDWSIRTSGWKLNELAKKIGTPEEIIKGWIRGNKKPTLKQVQELSLKTKRPLAAFLLPKPPVEKPSPKDYRMLPDKEGEFSRKTVLAIRKARYLQKLGQELALNVNANPLKKIKKITLKDKPEQVAKEYRELLNLTIEKQTKELKDAYKLYNYLRYKLEDFNVFCFQISMPLDDARGFTLADEIPKVIVANSADGIEPRIFTIMHEFGHVLLNDTSISIPNFDNQNTIEKWCNKFASAFLLPKEDAINIFNSKKSTLTETKTLNYLSRKYKVSKLMLLYNMSELKYITPKGFSEIIERPAKQKKTNKEKSGGGVPQDRKCLAELGVKFASLVADNLEKKAITNSDALSYLSIKSRNLNKVLVKAQR